MSTQEQSRGCREEKRGSFPLNPSTLSLVRNSRSPAGQWIWHRQSLHLLRQRPQWHRWWRIHFPLSAREPKPCIVTSIRFLPHNSQGQAKFALSNESNTGCLIGTPPPPHGCRANPGIVITSPPEYTEIPTVCGCFARLTLGPSVFLLERMIRYHKA